STLAAAQPPSPQPYVAPAPPQTVATPPLPAPEDIPTTTASRTELTMHVWDESAARRFVILNGQRMGEGDRNGELQVVSIERDGVVIERNGQRSRLRLP
ncbi:MAG TPA: general secretion pathway protein GspB, partial [Pseudoxanthomonas sp.]|nr:general secretion pathway protein GspB [Pseudoxanthomonas sp.]